MGYHRAGFDVVGVDHEPQKNYPFEFHQGDALEYCRNHGAQFDVIHASPPCQRWSMGTPDRSKYRDMIDESRRALLLAEKPYVIENVRHAPLRADVVICGCMVGLPLIKRRRHFETKPRLFVLERPCHHPGPVITVTGHGTTSGNRETWGRNISLSEKRDAMDIHWMNRVELSQAIPPAYTEYIGRHLIQALDPLKSAPDGHLRPGTVEGPPGGPRSRPAPGVRAPCV